MTLLDNNTGAAFLKHIPPHLIVAASAWISRIVTAVVQLISVRILMESLGTEQYAVFALLTGLMGWYMLSDMCIGISLQNHISECNANGQPHNKFIVATGILGILLLLLTIVFLYFISPYLAPIFLKHFTFMSGEEKTKSFFVVGALCIAASIGSIAYKIWYAQQKGYLSNIVPAIGSLISLGGIWWITKSGVPSKLYLSLLLFLSPPAVLAIVIFLWQIAATLKAAQEIDSTVFGRLVKRASKFWLFAIMAAIVLQIDYIMLSQYVSAQDIVIYTVSSKVFYIVAFMYTAVLAAFWPVCSEMIARNEWRHVQRHVKQYLLIGLVFMGASTVLITMFMPTILKILSPSKHIHIPVMFLLLLGLNFVIRAWTDTYAAVLQSMSDLRPFWVWVPLQAVLSIFLQFMLAPIYGIYGVILGLIASFLLTVTWSLPLSVQRHIQLYKGV